MFCVRGSFRRSTKQYVYKYACRLCGKPCDNDATKAIFILPRRHLSSETHTAQLETANEHGIIFEGAADETNFTKSAGHTLHTPVLLREVLQVIQPKNDQVIVDMTFGAGGHTKALLEECPGIRLFGLDRDPLAFGLATKLTSECSQVTALQGRFSEVHHLLASHGITANSVDAVLFDLGASSMQFDTAARGFSINKDGPLDMRMDSDRLESQPSAADVVNHMEEGGLYKIIKKYGEEKNARSIARAIVDSRYAFGRITTTGQLANIISTVFQSSHRQDKLMRHSHVATKTFQALRIFVNNEMNELYNGLEIAHHLLRPGTGVCVAISFHSLEDRVVKRSFQGIDMDAQSNMSIVDQNRRSAKFYEAEVIERVTQRRWETVRRATVPQEEDVEENPRARSAKLRAAVKLSCRQQSVY